MHALVYMYNFTQAIAATSVYPPGVYKWPASILDVLWYTTAKCLWVCIKAFFFQIAFQIAYRKPLHSTSQNWSRPDFVP